MPTIYYPNAIPQAHPVPAPNLIDQAFRAYQLYRGAQQQLQNQQQKQALYNLDLQNKQANLAATQQQLQTQQQATNQLKQNQEVIKQADQVFKQVLNSGLPIHEAEKASTAFLMRVNPQLGLAHRSGLEKEMQAAIHVKDFQTVADRHNALHENLITPEQAQLKYGGTSEFSLGPGQTRVTRDALGNVTSQYTAPIPNRPTSQRVLAPTPFNVWLQQNPGKPISEYFQLQRREPTISPQARLQLQSNVLSQQLRNNENALAAMQKWKTSSDYALLSPARRLQYDGRILQTQKRIQTLQKTLTKLAGLSTQTLVGSSNDGSSIKKLSDAFKAKILFSENPTEPGISTETTVAPPPVPVLPTPPAAAPATPIPDSITDPFGALYPHAFHR